MKKVIIGKRNNAPFIFKRHITNLAEEVAFKGPEPRVAIIGSIGSILIQQSDIGNFKCVYTEYNLEKTKNIYFHEFEKNYIKFCFVLEGVLRFRFNNKDHWKTMNKKKHNIFVNPPSYLEMKFASVPVKTFDIYMDPDEYKDLSADLENIKGFKSKLYGGEYGSLFPTDPNTGIDLLMKIAELFRCQKRDLQDYQDAEAKIEEIISYAIYNQFEEKLDFAVHFKELLLALEIKTFIEDNYAINNMILILIKRFQFDTKKINKYFKYFYHETLKSYQSKVRFEVAKNELEKNPNVSIKDLRALLGFMDNDYTSKFINAEGKLYKKNNK